MQQTTVDFSKLNILIVENHALMRRLLQEMLRGFGVQHIAQARNVPDGLEQIYAKDFDAVILDFFLGELDGADFARQVRHDEGCRNRWVPILLITGKPDHHRVLKVRDAGIHGMLAKPIAPKDLYWRLHVMLAKPKPFVISDSYVGPSRQPSQSATSTPGSYQGGFFRHSALRHGAYRHVESAKMPEIHHRTAIDVDEQIFA